MCKKDEVFPEEIFPEEVFPSDVFVPAVFPRSVVTQDEKNNIYKEFKYEDTSRRK